MALAIRDVTEQDLDAVLALNNGAGDGILPMQRQQLEWLFDHADYFRVAEVDTQLAGFLLAFRENRDHQSENYRWFQQRLESFLYIDRIVVAPNQRRFGVGHVFYCDVQSYAEVRVPKLTCEVFLEPRNDAAVLFHGTYGFQEVGQQIMQVQGRRVSLLEMDLQCLAFVHDRYPDGLPNLPWLRERLSLANANERNVAGLR